MTFHRTGMLAAALAAALLSACADPSGIAPGATRTAALASVLNHDIEQRMLAHTPIHRLGEPQDMANAALYLCSPAAAWVSGQILTVSGGGVQELD